MHMWYPPDWEQEDELPIGGDLDPDAYWCNCVIPKPIDLTLFRPYIVCDSCGLVLPDVDIEND